MKQTKTNQLKKRIERTKKIKNTEKRVKKMMGITADLLEAMVKAGH